jgi:hypothetical protein
MPPNVTSQRVQMTAVYASKARAMEGAIQTLTEFQRREPHLDLADRVGRIVARTAVEPLSFRSIVEWERDGRGVRQRGTPDAPVITLTPPNETFVVRFSEVEPMLRFDRLLSTAERIRNLVAFGVGQAVPMAIQLASRNLLHPITYHADPPSNVPREATTGDSVAAEAWYDCFRRGYVDAQLAVSGLAPNAAESRALSLVGEAMWSGDIEERFFYCWRALEVIGNLRLKQARERLRAGEPGASEPYLRAATETLLNGQPAKIDAPVRVKVALSERFPKIDLGRVDEFYDWRNAIAHGDVTTGQHLEILKAGPEIFALAYQSADPLIPRAADNTART